MNKQLRLVLALAALVAPYLIRTWRVGMEATPLPGILVDAPVSVAEAGELYDGIITPEAGGVYWFEVRYLADRRTLDANSPHGERSFGKAVHTAYGARFKLSVRAVSNGDRLEPVRPDWTPMEIATKRSRTSADCLDYTLHQGREYRVTLVVEGPSDLLQKSNPRLLVEMSDALRANARPHR